MTNKTYINPDAIKEVPASAIKEVPASAIKEVPASAIKEIPASAITDFTVDNLNIEFKTINGESIIGEGNINVVTTASAQTITGEKTFNSNIKISNKTIISSTIDSGELKVLHTGTTKGFIARTKSIQGESIPKLELLATDNYSSYQYDFPRTGGTIAMGVNVNGTTYYPTSGTGVMNLGNDYVTIKNINEKILFENFEEVTYEQLLNLINDCSLVKGKNYRIIDYVTTTIQDDTISANKPFDIIVTALSNNTLDENAKVCQPKGERKLQGGYIGGISGLIKTDTITPRNWGSIELTNKIRKIIYDYEVANNNNIQDNYDIVRDGYTINATAGTLNIKIAPRQNNVRVIGVELCNNKENSIIIDADYHLSEVTTSDTGFTANYYVSVPKNESYFVRILFVKPISTNEQVNLEIQNYSGHYFNSNDLSKWVIKYDVNNNINKYHWADAINGKGVIYYMKDEFDNECYYDFKNIKFKRTKEWVIGNTIENSNNNELNFTEDEKYFFTFDYNGNDDSLCQTGRYKCEQNSIGRLMSNKTQLLNNTIFLGNGNASNKIGSNNKNNTLGLNSYNNTIGSNFQENIIINGFAYNTIGNVFKNNLCKGKVNYNTIEHEFEGNKCYSTLIYNNLGTKIKNNTFNDTIQYSTFGSNIENNKFGGFLYYCTIKDYMKYCLTFPELHSVTIDTGILVGDSENVIDLSTTHCNGNSTIAESLVNKVDEKWSNNGLSLYLNESNEYYTFKNTFKTINGESIIGEGDIVIENELPVASNTTLGGVVVGSGLTVDNDGIMSLNDNFINLPSTVSGLTDTITKLSGIVEENEIVAAKALTDITEKVNSLNDNTSALTETVITWDYTSNMNNFTTTGTYKITGERTNTQDSLPIYNTGIIEAKLQVFAADNCVSQILTLLNVGGGDTNIYTRTRQNGEWEQWAKLQTNIEVGAIGVGRTKTFDHFIDNGMYSGVNYYWVNGNAYNAETFVLIVVNDYLYGAGITQLKYSIKQDGSVNIQTRKKISSEWTEWENVGNNGNNNVINIGEFNLNTLYNITSDKPISYYTGSLNGIKTFIEHNNVYSPSFKLKHGDSDAVTIIELDSYFVDITCHVFSSIATTSGSIATEEQVSNTLKNRLNMLYEHIRLKDVSSTKSISGEIIYTDGKFDFIFYQNTHKKVIIKGIYGSSEMRECKKQFDYNPDSNNPVA